MIRLSKWVVCAREMNPMGRDQMDLTFPPEFLLRVVRGLEIYIVTNDDLSPSLPW